MSDSTPAKKPKLKIGFTTVSIVPDTDGFAVRLDDKPMRSPRGADVILPTAVLAEAVAAEMRAAAPKLLPHSIPLTVMVSTALDRIRPSRADIESQILAYAETELLCHRATEPADLVALEQAVWGPLLDWLAHRHDALLSVVSGIVAKPQNPDALKALAGVIAVLDIWKLTALSVIVSASGSLVIGLAMLDQHIDAEAAFDAAELDASYQIDKWGEDEEARRHRAEVRGDLDLAARFLSLL